jgi:arylsulfatase A-like enzyme
MVDEIADHIDRMRHEPKFFQAIHLCNIHVPFCVHYPYSTYFPPSFGPVPNRFGYRALYDQLLEKKRKREAFSPEMTSWIFTQEVNLYRALVRCSDDSFGGIIDALKRAGLYDNSFVVLLADHGENLPEQGLRYRYGSSTHGFFLWGDRDTHVPLAIKFPGRKYAGRRVEGLSRSIDIAPTLLDALGLPPLAKADGVSRMPEIEGRGDAGEHWVYAETGLSAPKMFIRGHLAYAFKNYPELHVVDPESLLIYKKKEFMPNLVAAKDRMIRTERWKLISYPVVEDGKLTFKPELFDVTVDPHNGNDLSTTHPEVLVELGKHLRPLVEQDIAEFGTGPIERVEDPEREGARRQF